MKSLKSTMANRLTFKRDADGIERFQVVPDKDYLKAKRRRFEKLSSRLVGRFLPKNSKANQSQTANAAEHAVSDKQSCPVQSDDVPTDNVMGSEIRIVIIPADGDQANAANNAKDASSAGLSSGHVPTGVTKVLKRDTNNPKTDKPSNDSQSRNAHYSDATSLDIKAEEDEKGEEDEVEDEGEFGVAIEIPEEDIVSVKEETCCHGVRIAVGAFLIYFVMTFYQSLNEDIMRKLQDEYMSEVFDEVHVGQNYPDTIAIKDPTLNDYLHKELLAVTAVPSDDSVKYENFVLSRDRKEYDDEVVESTAQDIFKIYDTYNKTKALFGLVSAILVVLFNYRKVILAGSLINILALAVGAFVRDYKALVFLLGFCTGLGNNLLYVSTTVAVLERFRKHRVMAATLPVVASALGYLLVAVLKTFLFDVVFPAPSQLLIGLLAGLYLLCLVAALLVKPLSLKVKDAGDTFRERALNISGLELFRAKGIYVLSAIVFFYNYNKETPLEYVEAILPAEQAQYADTAVQIGGSLGSALIWLCTGGCCFCCRLSKCCKGEEHSCCRLCVYGCFRFLSVHRLTIVVTVTCIMAALNCLFVIPMENNLVYIIAYSAILGIVTGVCDPLLTVAVPTLLGERFTTLGVGTTNFALGLASLISMEAAEPLVAAGETKVIFYMGIPTFIVAAVLSVVLNRLHHYKMVIPADSPATGPEALRNVSEDLISIDHTSIKEEEIA